MLPVCLCVVSVGVWINAELTHFTCVAKFMMPGCFFQQNNFHNWTLLLWFPKHKFKKLEIIIIMIKKETLGYVKEIMKTWLQCHHHLTSFYTTLHTGSLFDQCMSLKNSFTCKDGLVRRWVSLLGMMTFNVPDKLWY